MQQPLPTNTPRTLATTSQGQRLAKHLLAGNILLALQSQLAGHHTNLVLFTNK